jgi:hypothetical protein
MLEFLTTHVLNISSIMLEFSMANFFKHFHRHARIVDVDTSSMTLEALKKNFSVFVNIIDVDPTAMLEDSTGPCNIFIDSIYQDFISKLIFYSVPFLL